jgi:hypothetical protein
MVILDRIRNLLVYQYRINKLFDLSFAQSHKVATYLVV